MKRSLIFLLCSLFLSTTALAESFFTSENYWNGKTAYDKGDFETAMKLWKDSANQDVGEAQGFVGALYHGGQGIEKDYKKAMEWYQKAAVQGIPQAQLGIGSLYADGYGVEKDYIKARMWFSISEINGSERAEQYLKKIDQRMTKEEIKESDAMAVDWMNKHQRK